MKAKTKAKLLAAWEYCDDNDKSTEFMLQYMQDVAGVDLDCVIKFLSTHRESSIQLNQYQIQEDTCNKCTDTNGQNIGNMYVCDKCGRAVS